MRIGTAKAVARLMSFSQITCCILLQLCFYARQQNASRVLAIVEASVRPSVTLCKTTQSKPNLLGSKRPVQGASNRGTPLKVA